MFINLGSMDGFDPGRMLKYLAEVTEMPGTFFGRIDIKGVYSFIDIEENKLDEVLSAFRNEVFRGRKVRVDSSGTSKSGRSSSPREGRKGRGESSWGDRGGDRGSRGRSGGFEKPSRGAGKPRYEKDDSRGGFAKPKRKNK